MKRRNWLTITVVLVGGGCAAGPVFAQSPAASATTCAAMLSLSIPDTELTSASVVPQNGARPAHCRVVGVTHGEPGSNVGVEVRLPDGWNGKLLFTTRQGYMGATPPVGNAIVSDGLARHYAIVTTDGGHIASTILDASFGLNNRPAEIDFGYRGVHLAKAVGATVIA